MKKLLILPCLILFFVLTNAQKGAYYSFGYYIESLKYTEPFTLVLTDYNQYFQDLNAVVEKPFETTPGMLHGAAFGFKYNDKFLSIGFDLHLHRYFNTSEAYDSSYTNFYYRKYRISHKGFSLIYTLNIIHSEHFRVGPSISINLDKYKVGLKTQKGPNLVYINYVDKFFISPSFRFPISIGGEKFNFDIIPYYTLPLYNVDISSFNENINLGNSTVYSSEQMSFKPTNMGLIIALNFGF